MAASSKVQFAPDNSRPERPLGAIVRGRDAVVVDERKEMPMVLKERSGQVPHVVIGGIHMTLRQGEELLFDRQDARDQFCAGERGAPRPWVTSIAMPEPKQAALQHQGFAAKASRRGRAGQFQRAQQIPPEMTPAKLPL